MEYLNELGEISNSWLYETIDKLIRSNKYIKFDSIRNIYI